MSTFYKYFKENMEALGLPVPPETLYGTVQLATGNAAIILAALDKFGTEVTVGELIGAGTKLEYLAVITACSAVFYCGALVGSIAVAIGRSMAGGTSIADVIAMANQYGLNRPWLSGAVQRWPGIYNEKAVARNTYRDQATRSAA